MPKCIYGIEFYSSENCCYGYQIQINNQFMPILFTLLYFLTLRIFCIFLNMELYEGSLGRVLQKLA